jgi:hypothetical protein
MQTISYQLKYCERCGSLRLRRADSAEDYCPSCERAVWQSLSPDDLVSKLRRKPRAQKSRARGLRLSDPRNEAVQPPCRGQL